MPIRMSSKSAPPQDVALELAKAALASGALQRQPETGKTAGDQSRLDATYVSRLYAQISQRLSPAEDKR